MYLCLSFGPLMMTSSNSQVVLGGLDLNDRTGFPLTATMASLTLTHAGCGQPVSGPATFVKRSLVTKMSQHLKHELHMSHYKGQGTNLESDAGHSKRQVTGN